MTEPTDAEIESAWTEATGSRILPYPDDMQAFARTVLVKWGTQSHCNPPPAFFTVFAKWNEDEVPLAQYSASSECGVLERVMEAAQREGYKGVAKDRMAELGWRIGPVYAEPLPVKREPLTEGQIRAMCKESWVFETAKQWVRITEQHHGIPGGQHGDAKP